MCSSERVPGVKVSSDGYIQQAKNKPKDMLENNSFVDELEICTPDKKRLLVSGQTWYSLK